MPNIHEYLFILNPRVTNLVLWCKLCIP